MQNLTIRARATAFALSLAAAVLAPASTMAAPPTIRIPRAGRSARMQ